MTEVLQTNTPDATQLLKDELWVRCLRNKANHQDPGEECFINLVILGQAPRHFGSIGQGVFILNASYAAMAHTQAHERPRLEIEYFGFRVQDIYEKTHIEIGIQRHLDAEVLPIWKGVGAAVPSIKKWSSVIGNYAGFLALPPTQQRKQRIVSLERTDETLFVHYGVILGLLKGELLRYRPRFGRDDDGANLEKAALNFLDHRFQFFVRCALRPELEIPYLPMSSEE